MAAPLILTIDQGTTSSRALVVDAAGAIRGVGQHSFPQLFPQPGWVEHDPEAIWRSTLDAVRDALKAAATGPSGITAIGITNQRETVVIWDRVTGAPLHNAIVWQDRRTAPICDELRDRGFEPRLAQDAGLTLDPYFSGTKLTWLARNVAAVGEAARAGRLAVGTIDSWLIWKLTGGRRHVTDMTNASRTLLLDIDRCAWSDELCDAFEVTRGALPEVLPSRATFGRTAGAVFNAETPILAVAGDQQSALFGQACVAPGQAKNTYGTGCFLLAEAGRESVRSRNRLLTSLGVASEPGRPAYVREGSVFVAGSLVQWLRDELGIIRTSAEIEPLAASVPDSGGVTIVPAFTGLGAPHWDPHARGAILGLTRGATKAHIARAALEAIALSSAELVGAMNADLPAPIAELRVDGGAAANNLLMQLQADLAGVPVLRPVVTESTAMGAAFLAGIEAGIWAGPDEAASLWTLDRRFEPAISSDEREARLGAWRSSVARVRSS
ncbi:MAG: glycerol kinase GlpK [Dehalococcoidia bacterium]